MMNLSQLDETVAVAQRFIIRAAEAKRRIKCEMKAADTSDEWGEWHTKETAACRRASLDLTRSLADLRRTR